MHAEINLIKPDTILPEVKVYLWDVHINGLPYFVGRFPGFIHTIGGKWGENDLWAWPREQEPSYNNLIEYDGEGGAHWGIRCETSTYLKTKYGETRTVDRTIITITRNKKDFYQFVGSRDLGIDQAKIYIQRIEEHPIQFNNIDYMSNIIGRKIWWRSQPARITEWFNGTAEFIVEPDGMDHFEHPAEFSSFPIVEEPIKTDIFDPFIYWFRF